MASLQLIPAAVSNPEFKRALLFSLRLQHSPQTRPLRDLAVDRIIERDFLLANDARGLTIKDLVEQSALTFGGRSAVSLRDIGKSVDRLVESRVIVRKPVLVPAAYILTESARTRLWAAQSDAEALIQRVHEKLFRTLPSWRAAFERAFDDVISNVFSRLGEMYVRALRGQMSRDELACARIVQDAIGTACLTFGVSIRDSLTTSVSRFFRETDIDFDRLKWNLSQNFYIAKALGLDASGELLSAEIFAHSAFYLDTNVIIAALEPTDSRHAAFRSFVNACRKLDITMFVSQVTLHELQNVITHYRRLFAKVSSEIPEALSPFVSDYFYQAYRRQVLEAGPTTLDEFFAKFESPLDGLDKEYGVKRVDADWFIREPDSSETRALAEELQHLRRPKTKKAATHDALMIRWVDRVREMDKENVYFLTFDRSLPRQSAAATRGRPASLTLDALLQWIGPNISDDALVSDFARMYSAAIQQQLLPVDNFFELSDFCMLAEMECECSELPPEDVIECLHIIKSRAPELDPSLPEDREKLAHEIQRFFAGPGRKHHELVERLRSSGSEIESNLRAEIATRDAWINYGKTQIAGLQDTLAQRERESTGNLQTAKLRHSAIVRAMTCCFLFVLSELITLALAAEFGTGRGIVQKVGSWWAILLGQAPLWAACLIFVEGNERLKQLGWRAHRVLEWITGKPLNSGEN